MTERPTPPIRPLPAIVLAAGRGERMRPLTDRMPKPLLPVQGQPLIAWHLEALARDGVQDVVVNTAWLGEQFEPALGDGAAYGVSIRYSHEGPRFGGALETAGGIATALPLLCAGGAEAFWVVSADIWAPGFRFDAALAQRFADSSLDACLWLVANPPFHPRGDFALGEPLPSLGPDAHRASAEGERLTYANFALIHRRLLAGIKPGTRAALGPLLHQAVATGRVAALRWTGTWHNVGTPEQWAALQEA